MGAPLTNPFIAGAYAVCVAPLLVWLAVGLYRDEQRLRDVAWRRDVRAAKRLWRHGTATWRNNLQADVRDRRDAILRVVSIPAGAALILRAGIWGFAAALAESDDDISTGLRRTPIDVPLELEWAARLTVFALGLGAIQFIGIPEWGWPAWQRYAAYAWLAPNLAVLLADPLLGVETHVRRNRRAAHPQE